LLISGPETLHAKLLSSVLLISYLRGSGAITKENRLPRQRFFIVLLSLQANVNIILKNTAKAKSEYLTGAFGKKKKKIF
jgi:hypothetical protein